MGQGGALDVFSMVVLHLFPPRLSGSQVQHLAGWSPWLIDLVGGLISWGLQQCCAVVWAVVPPGIERAGAG